MCRAALAVWPMRLRVARARARNVAVTPTSRRKMRPSTWRCAVARARARVRVRARACAHVHAACATRRHRRPFSPLAPSRGVRRVVATLALYAPSHTRLCLCMRACVRACVRARACIACMRVRRVFAQMDRKGLFKRLKDLIGTDLTRIAVPVFFNEPTSFLHRMAEACEFYTYLDKVCACAAVAAIVRAALRRTLRAQAAAEADPAMRALYVVVSSIVPYSCGERTSKVRRQRACARARCWRDSAAVRCSRSIRCWVRRSSGRHRRRALSPSRCRIIRPCAPVTCRPKTGSGARAHIHTHARTHAYGARACPLALMLQGAVQGS